jgi:NADH-quinone oxidoreductase subunit H
MLLVTIFLGGWELPFLHRDGLTIQFGDAMVVHQVIPHIWMEVISVLAFFGKVAAVCWFQAIIRWSLPRFRYDQLQKLGWRTLLPLALANVLVTGVVALAIDRAGPGTWNALDVAAQVSQAAVAAVITYVIGRLTIGFFTKRPRRPRIVGSAAKSAAKTGGTPITPMQA